METNLQRTLALKTFSVDRLVPCGKNETLFLMVAKCIWSPESFLQNRSKPGAKMTNFAIPHYIKKWFAPSGPDFYAIFKMVHHFSVLQKLAKLLSNL